MRNIFPFSRNNDIHLCLSGGGALGFAHIGAIQALEENGIFPTQISGTSIGAVMGVFYAAGIKPEDMLQVIKEAKLYKISKLLTFHSDFWNRGLSDHTTLRKLIRQLIPHNSFEGLEKKLFVCVSNMTEAKWEIISSGDNLDKWIAASASIPGVFEPIKHKSIFYADGGILNNLPAQCFENNFRTTIGVDVIPYTKLKTKALMDNTKLYNIAFASVRAMQHQNSQEGRDICNFLIEPLVLDTYHEFSYEEYENIYRIGYDATVKYIKANKDILSLSKK